ILVENQAHRGNLRDARGYVFLPAPIQRRQCRHWRRRSIWIRPVITIWASATSGHPETGRSRPPALQGAIEFAERQFAVTPKDYELVADLARHVSTRLAP